MSAAGSRPPLFQSVPALRIRRSEAPAGGMPNAGASICRSGTQGKEKRWAEQEQSDAPKPGTGTETFPAASMAAAH
jgi:hypothetical protein